MSFDIDIILLVPLKLFLMHTNMNKVRAVYSTWWSSNTYLHPKLQNKHSDAYDGVNYFLQTLLIYFTPLKTQ